MDKNKLKLTSSEIGTLWGEYINGTMTDVVNRYMVSIIEDELIKTIFEDAIKMFDKQKQQITLFLENEGFPVPIGFTESDLFKGKQRLFTDIFCLKRCIIKQSRCCLKKEIFRGILCFIQRKIPNIFLVKILRTAFLEREEN